MGPISNSWRRGNSYLYQKVEQKPWDLGIGRSSDDMQETRVMAKTSGSITNKALCIYTVLQRLPSSRRQTMTAWHRRLNPKWRFWIQKAELLRKMSNYWAKYTAANVESSGNDVSFTQFESSKWHKDITIIWCGNPLDLELLSACINNLDRL